MWRFYHHTVPLHFLPVQPTCLQRYEILANPSEIHKSVCTFLLIRNLSNTWLSLEDSMWSATYSKSARIRHGRHLMYSVFQKLAPCIFWTTQSKLNRSEWQASCQRRSSVYFLTAHYCDRVSDRCDSSMATERILIATQWIWLVRQLPTTVSLHEAYRCTRIE